MTQSLELSTSHRLLFSYLASLLLIDKRRKDFLEISNSLQIRNPLFAANHEMLKLLHGILVKDVQAQMFGVVQMQDSFFNI